MSMPEFGQGDRRSTNIGVGHCVIAGIRAEHIQSREVARIVPNQQRLSWLSESGQYVGPITNALEVDAVSLQAAVNYRQKANDKPLRVGRQRRVEASCKTCGPCRCRRRAQYPVDAVVVLSAISQ